MREGKVSEGDRDNSRERGIECGSTTRIQCHACRGALQSYKGCRVCAVEELRLHFGEHPHELSNRAAIAGEEKCKVCRCCICDWVVKNFDRCARPACSSGNEGAS